MKKVLIIAIVSMLLLTPVASYAEAPVINQHPELPTGCEATALTMLLNWAGVDVGKEDVARKIPWGPRPQNGFGANPHKEFVGNPFSITGFGVYDVPIYNTLDSYMPGLAMNLTGQPFKKIVKVAETKPVVIWITRGFEVSRPTRTWEDKQGNSIVWVAPEHAVLLVKCDTETGTIHDPDTGRAETVSLSRLKASWDAMGKRAVTVKFQKVTVQKEHKKTKAVLINGRTYVPEDFFPFVTISEDNLEIGHKVFIPVRAQAEKLGYKVGWNNKGEVTLIKIDRTEATK